MTTINRCCRDTLRIELEKLRGPFPDGLEISCRWCDGFWRWTDSEWVHHDELKRRIDRMTRELASPEYQAEKDRVLGKRY